VGDSDGMANGPSVTVGPPPCYKPRQPQQDLRQQSTSLLLAAATTPANMGTGWVMLANFGVSGYLQDPVLELHQTNAQGQDVFLATNDNWKQTQEFVIKGTGLAPQFDSEAAILKTLMQGSYTAILRGVGAPPELVWWSFMRSSSAAFRAQTISFATLARAGLLAPAIRC
jgi:hypothetical protein